MLKSIVSTGGFNLVSQLLIFIVEIFIARILLPSDFGAFALALIVVELFSVIALKSFAMSFVQSKSASELDLSSIALLTTIISICCAGLSYLLVRKIALYWGGELFISSYSILVWILPFLTLEYIYRLALMKRRRYWQVAASELISVVVYAIIAIVLSLNEFGFYSLIYAFMSRQIIKLSIVLFLAKYEYKLLPGFRCSSIVKHSRMSIAMTIQSLFLFSTSNTDRYFVTLAGGVAGVGLYTRALKLLQMPLNQIVRNVSSVLYVEFSNKQDDKTFLLNTFITTTSILASLFIPASTLVVIYADLIVSTVYGENWIEMVPILRVLIVGAVISSMSIIAGDLLKSQGIVYREIISNIFALFILVVVSLLLYESFSVVGVAVAFVCGQLAFLLCQILFLFKILKVSPFIYLKAYLLPVFVSIVIYCCCSLLLVYFSRAGSFFIVLLFVVMALTSSVLLFKKNPVNFKQKIMKFIL